MIDRDGDEVTGRVVRWGWYSVGVNVLLILLHGVVALASGSLAVVAELVHNLLDLVAAAAVLGGIKLAMRKSPTFPYGLYKVENLVAAALAMLIFFTAYEIAREALFARAGPPSVDGWMLVILVVSTAIPLVFSHFEMRVGRIANSPALMADAREYRVHAYTTGLAFSALLSAWFDLPLDRIAALIIVAAVAKAGWDLLMDAVRVLLDASIDAECLGRIRRLIEENPAVTEVGWITGRNAGRLRFIEAGVTLRTAELAKAAAVMKRIEESVRAELPHIERVLLQPEAPADPHRKIAMPLADLTGAISDHFGEAPYFAFVTLAAATGKVEEQRIRANPYKDEERGKGLRVAEWLVAEKVDTVLLFRSLKGKGPEYVFRDAGVAVQLTRCRTLPEAISVSSGETGEGRRRLAGDEQEEKM